MNSTQKVKQHWKILTLVLIATTLSSLITASLYQAFANPVSPSIYLDDLPSSAYYTVKTDGTNEWVVRYDGYKAYEGTDDDTVINWALANLPSDRLAAYRQEKVLLDGSFSINDPLVVYSSTDLQIDGKIVQTDSADNLIQNGNPSTYNINVDIHGTGILYGGLNSIYWRHTTSPGQWYSRVSFYDLQIYHAESDGFEIDCTSGWGVFIWRNIMIEGCHGAAMYLKEVHDWFGDTVMLGGDAYGLRCEGGSAGHLTNFYAYQSTTAPFYLRQVSWFELNTGFVDVNGLTDCFELYDVSHSSFTQINVHLGYSDGHNTKYAVHLQSYGGTPCKHNRFSDWFVGRSHWQSGTNRLAYAIYEDASQDYNMYENIDAYDAYTSGFKIQGANSHISDSWNQTSWIDSYP